MGVSQAKLETYESSNEQLSSRNSSRNSIVQTTERVAVRIESLGHQYSSKRFMSEIIKAQVRAVHSRIQPRKGHNWGYSGKRLWVDDGFSATFIVTLR
mmetsp:Transcript_23028/g.46226  ORF Transcript_23028/g.46226 Transcript_23028/m.46226 type:complete len:98 (-) Transcript_23028:461-754(-)